MQPPSEQKSSDDGDSSYSHFISLHSLTTKKTFKTNRFPIIGGIITLDCNCERISDSVSPINQCKSRRICPYNNGRGQCRWEYLLLHAIYRNIHSRSNIAYQC